MSPKSPVAVAAIFLCLLTFFAGCGEDTPQATAKPCGASTGNYCYHLGDIVGLYCDVQQVRDLLADDKVTMSDLPDWATARKRGDTTVVYDFRTFDNVPAGQRRDQLRTALDDKDLQFDYDTSRACSKSITQQRVHDSEGGWPAFAPGKPEATKTAGP